MQTWAFLVVCSQLRPSRPIRRHAAVLVLAEAAQPGECERFNQGIDDAIALLVGYCDADLICRYGNRAHREWFGRSSEEVMGMSLTDLLGGDLFELNKPYILAALAGQEQRFQSVVRRPDGKVGYAMVSFIPDRIGDGVRGFIAIATDIGEVKQSELQFAQMNEQLAQRAMQAEEANRAKSAFLANMSHEIRTPMNAIIGLTHLISRDTTDPLALDRLAKVDDAAQHLMQVINDVLDLSKVEAGKVTLDHREFAIDEVLEKAAAMVRGEAAAKGLELIFDSDHLPDRLMGDPMRLSQCLINLLGNAVKFTATGWVRMRGSLTGIENGRLRARFEVQDTGPGIPAELQPKLFDAFEQADNSTTRVHGGTGLGLALTRQLSALMGGQVGLRSSVGGGSTFWFTAEFDSAENSTERTLGHAFDGLRVLLVDDVPEALEAIGDRMRMFGMNVESCSDGAGALAMLTDTVVGANPFDVMVVDWKMPGMDGLETIRQACRSPAHQLLPVVLMCAHDDGAVRGIGRDLGVTVLVKPITATALADVLAVALQAGHGAANEQEPEDALVLLRRRHAGQRVLLAEDNPINQEVASELLRLAGLIVETADDGQRAVELALVRDYALVLMDMQMPMMDGLEATRTLRRRLGPALPILAMTAAAFADDQAACLAAGMNDHLVKPVVPELLYRTLLRWLPQPRVLSA